MQQKSILTTYSLWFCHQHCNINRTFVQRESGKCVFITNRFDMTISVEQEMKNVYVHAVNADRKTDIC